jgi:hypothetical protein
MRIGDLGALEGVRAHELSEPVGLVRRRVDRGPHLVQHDVVTTLRELPRRLRSCEATTDHTDWPHASRYAVGREL